MPDQTSPSADQTTTPDSTPAPWTVNFRDGMWDVTCSDGSLGGRFPREGDARTFADVAGPGPMTIVSKARLDRLAALGGDAAATPQPADDADRRALDSIAELCGARAGDHRDNVVMVVRSMLRDPAAHNARRARALAVTGRLVEVVADLIRDHEDPGTEAFGALWEGREFLSQGGGAASAPPVDVTARLAEATEVADAENRPIARGVLEGITELLEGAARHGQLDYVTTAIVRALAGEATS